MNRTIRHFGGWHSPFSAAWVAMGQQRPSEPVVLGRALFWLESRPGEGGRSALMYQAPGVPATNLLPAGFSARSRVHEYGGGAFATDGRRCWFVNDADQDIYRLDTRRKTPRLYHRCERCRYGDLRWDGHRGRLVGVAECIDRAGREPAAALVALDGQDAQTLVSGRDFLAAPRLSPDGRYLAWLAWDHPYMPWDAAELWLAALDGRGRPTEARRLAGGPEESVFQPEFSPDGALFYVSDRSGWWNIYRFADAQVRAVCRQQAEFGLPLWQLGLRSYAVVDQNRLLCARNRAGVRDLGVLTVETGRFQPLALPYNDYAGVNADGDRAVFVGASPSRSPTVVSLALTEATTEELRPAIGAQVSEDYFSAARPVRFESAEGEAHGLFYPPVNPEYAPPAGQRPPLLLKCHGGPTGAASPGLDLRVQYWTSRGFAVFDVDYRGSTGYGRAYRQALYGRWGELDVADCVSGVDMLAARGWIDPRHTAISGNSAGGYTVLAALCFSDRFRAGASYYGIGDLAALARDTHKFESHYVERLIGPWPAAEALYRARSPLCHAQRFSCPVIFFQGLRDRIVPPDQAQAMVRALKAKGLEVGYLGFADEGHGFRRAETIMACLRAELGFYARVFGFDADGAELPPAALA